MIRRLFFVASVVLALAAPAAHAQTTEVGGVKYDNTLQIGSSRVQLNGAGIRYKAVFKVYTAGLYLTTKAATTEAVLAAPGVKRLHIVMLRDIDANELGKLFTRGMQDNSPREEFAKLARSPVMKPVDDEPVWSIICFVVPSLHRGQGVARALLDGAIAYARKRGATLVEAYPVDRSERSKDDAMWFGAKAMYDHAGFKEVARRKPTRPVVRLEVKRGAKGKRRRQ